MEDSSCLLVTSVIVTPPQVEECNTSPWQTRGGREQKGHRGVIGSVYILNHLLFSTLFLCDSDIVPTLLFTTRQVNNITTKSGEILGARGGGTSLDIGV